MSVCMCTNIYVRLFQLAVVVVADIMDNGDVAAAASTSTYSSIMMLCCYCHLSMR